MGIILVKNNKGGVGKTYITLQLAAHKALIKNKKTLILTSDSQNDILKFAGIKIEDTSKAGLEDFIEGKSYKIKKLRENLFFLHLQGYKIKNSFDEAFKRAIKLLKDEYDYIVIDGSPVMGLDNLFIEISDHIVIPTFLDSITTHSVLSMLKKVDLNKVKAVVPNRTGRTKLEKEYYDFLNKKLGVQGIHLSFPIPEISLISKLIDKETLIWESKSQKLDYDFDVVISSKSEIKEFDFASYELNDVEIATVSEQEKIFMNTYKKMKNNLFDMCSSLALIEKTLKPTGSFMAWYSSK